MNAQKKAFNKGYLVKQSGDTIQGLVKDRSTGTFVSLYTKIRFKEAGSSRTKKYGPDDILGYGYHGQNFVSMPFREEIDFFKFRYYTDSRAPRVFLKVVRKSEQLIYFEQLFVHEDSSYLDSTPFFYRPDTSELVRVTQGILGFKRKRLAEYFSDCPALAQELYGDDRTIGSISDLYEFCLERCIANQ